MSEVNVLWSSAWAKLQKNLASSLAAGDPVAGYSLFATPPQGAAPVQCRALPTSSWLVRARSRKTQASQRLQ